MILTYVDTNIQRESWIPFQGAGEWGMHFKLEILSPEIFHMGLSWVYRGGKRQPSVSTECTACRSIAEPLISNWTSNQFCCYNNQTNWPIKGWSWSVIQSFVQSMAVLTAPKTNSTRRPLVGAIRPQNVEKGHVEVLSFFPEWGMTQKQNNS